ASVSATSSGGSGPRSSRTALRCAETLLATRSPTREKGAQPGHEALPQVGVVGAEGDHGLQVVQRVGGGVAPTAEDHPVHRVLPTLRQCLQRVGELDLVPAPGGCFAQHVEDPGAEHVPADHRQVARRLLGGGLLHHVRHPHHVRALAAVRRLDGGAAVEADLFRWHLHQCDHRAPSSAWAAIIAGRISSRGSIRSSPSWTAKGTSPTWSAAVSTAWPRPSASPWRTTCTRARSLVACTFARRAWSPLASSARSSSGAASKWSAIASWPRPVISSASPMPAAAASDTTYSIEGASTTGSIALGIAFVAGWNRVDRPATGITVLVTVLMVEG